MATIHPFLYYNDMGSLNHGTFWLIVDCNAHDTIAVHVFQHHLVVDLKDVFSTVGKVVYLSGVKNT